MGPLPPPQFVTFVTKKWFYFLKASLKDPLDFKNAFEEFQTDRIYFDKQTGKPTDSSQDCSDVWKITTSKYFCEKFTNYPSDENCSFNPYHLERCFGSVRFLLNQSILENIFDKVFVDDLINFWLLAVMRIMPPFAGVHPGARARGAEILGRGESLQAARDQEDV